MRWTPHVTVAAVVQREDRYLVVEEAPGGRPVLNQPAGHLEAGESLIDAVQREVYEETGYRFEAGGLLGVYRWQVPGTDHTFLRFCFVGEVDGERVASKLDPAINAVHWLTRVEIASGPLRPRSPLVLRCIDDAALRAPLPLGALIEMRESGA